MLDKKRKAKLGQAIGDYNRKLTRLEKNNPALKGVLPERLDAKALKREVTTKDEYNALMADIRRFNRQRGIDLVQIGDVVKTDYEVDQIKRLLKRVNEQRADERKRLGLTDRKDELGTIRELSLKDKKIPKIRSEFEYRKFVEGLKKQSSKGYINTKNELYVLNLKKAMKNQIPIYGDKIVAVLDTMTTDEILQYYASHGDVTFEFAYGAQAEEEKFVAIMNDLYNDGFIDAEDYDKEVGPIENILHGIDYDEYNF